MKPSKATMGNRKKLVLWIEKNLCKPICKLKANHKCELCHSDGKAHQLHAHHIEGKQTYYMRTNLDNLVCLCASCHAYGVHSDIYSVSSKTLKKLSDYIGPERMERLAKGRHDPLKAKMPLGEVVDLYEELSFLLEKTST